jgi:methionyl aminopeptidase
MLEQVVCHGIPDDRKLENGDMISIDVSVYYNGFHGDNCGTVLVGTGHREVDSLLIQATQEGLSKAISVCKPGA